MPRWGKVLAWILGTPAVLFGLLVLVAYLTTFHPPEVQEEPVHCAPSAPVLPQAARFKILSWNIQYLAGKGYVFFYDVPDDAGPDERPSPEAIARTLEDVVRVIRDENPDLVLLQEVDDGSARTDGQDQLALLNSQLADRYPCHASAFYWKAAFVPHPRILGKVGMKLSILSRYRIRRATRYQLPQIPEFFLRSFFNFKRAVLRVDLEGAGGTRLSALNTHLDAFAQGTDAMRRQVDRIREILETVSRDGFPWVLGGDFNLLPSRAAYDRLAPGQQSAFQPDTELATLLERYRSVPSPAQADGPERQRWYTAFPNDPSVPAPDRTIDYLFLSNRVALARGWVRQADTLRISDHFPVGAEVSLRPE